MANAEILEPIQTLTPKQQQFYRMFIEGEDADIDILFAALYPNGEQDMQTWKKQQYLGSFITKMNRRLRGFGKEIKPGRAKMTYRLQAAS